MEKKLTKRNWIKFICIFLPLISIIAAYSYINLNGFKIAQMLEEYRDYKWEIVIRGYTQEKQPYEKRYIGNIGQKDTVIKTIRNSTFRRIYNYKENENDIPFFELSIVDNSKVLFYAKSINNIFIVNNLYDGKPLKIKNYSSVWGKSIPINIIWHATQ